MTPTRPCPTHCEGVHGEHAQTCAGHARWWAWHINESDCPGHCLSSACMAIATDLGARPMAAERLAS